MMLRIIAEFLLRKSEIALRAAGGQGSSFLQKESEIFRLEEMWFGEVDRYADFEAPSGFEIGRDKLHEARVAGSTSPAEDMF